MKRKYKWNPETKKVEEVISDKPIVYYDRLGSVRPNPGPQGNKPCTLW
jgi:hypothetical protein